MPRNVQKDPESSLTWVLKDEVVRRGKVYYAKLARGKAMFLAPRMIPYFHALWGVRRSDEPRRLSRHARAILRVLRREWEMATSDLRDESGVKDRAAFTRAIDELQAAMIVVPSEVVYQPKFTYIWTLGVSRFPDALRRRVGRPTALREIARAFLAGAGATFPGELARVTGLSRPDAGLGNRALVAEGYATTPARGEYRLRVGLPDALGVQQVRLALLQELLLPAPHVASISSIDAWASTWPRSAGLPARMSIGILSCSYSYGGSRQANRSGAVP